MKQMILLLSFLLLFLPCESKYLNGKSHQPVSSSTAPLSQKAKNVILMIGDGMGLTHITAGLIANGNNLSLEQFPYCGFIKTYSSDNLITDSGAGATAIACGVKTNNGAIGVDASGKPVKTLLEISEEKGMASGLVVTSSVTHATPASFIAHQVSRTMEEAVAYDFLKTDIDVFIGGGRKYFAERTDKLNLLDSLRKRNYIIANTIDSARLVTNGKLAVLVAEEHLASVQQGRGDFLEKATAIALDILDDNKNGFFLMVESSQIDWGGHNNDIDYIVSEMVDFDKAIGSAINFAKKNSNTLVIVTADHETGGLAITGGLLQDRFVEAKFSTKAHTGSLIPVFAYGPGAEIFSGIYENTDIFYKMMKAMGIDTLPALR